MVGMTSCKASTVIPNYTNTFCSVNSGADVYTGLSLNACVDEILAYSGQSSVTTFNGPIFVDCFALFCQDQWLFSSGRPIGFTPFGGQFTGWYDVLPNYTPQPTKTGVINVLQNGNTLYTLDLTYTPPNNVSEPKMFWLIIIGLLFVMFPSQPKK
jgi:hypothetical protein